MKSLPEKVRCGASHYQQHSIQTSTVLDQLFQGYRKEGVAMPYMMEDFQREYRAARFKELTKEERLELIKQMSLDERIEDFSPKGIESYLQRCKRESASPKPKKKK